MPNSRLQWRALAWLGALLLIGLMSPTICAARPFPPHGSYSNGYRAERNSSTDRPNELSNFFSVLNRNTSDFTNRTLPDVRPNTPKIKLTENRLDNPVVLLQKPRRKPYDSHRVTVDTIKSIFRRNQQKMNSNYHHINLSSKHRPIATTETSPSAPFDADKFNISPTTVSSGLILDRPTSAVWSPNSQNQPTTIATEDSSASVTKQTPFEWTEKAYTNGYNKQNDIDDDDYDKDTNYSNATLTTSTYDIIDVRTTKQSAIQSVFLDYVNFNESMTLRNDIKFNSTTKKSETLSRTDRGAQSNTTLTKRKKRLRAGTNLERNERSANLSLAKTSKRIQLLIKSRLLQLLPDGTVNGTQNDESDYSKSNCNFHLKFTLLH